MAGNVGIPIALFIFVGLLAFTIGYNGWNCGLIVDNNCLNKKPTMPVVLGLISGAGVFALLAAILFAVHISTESEGLRIAAALLTVLAAGSAIAAIFYFYKVEIKEKHWCQDIAMFASGLGSGVMLCLLGTFFESLL